MKAPTIGSIVIYHRGSRANPAIVTHVWPVNWEINLSAFTDGSFEGPQDSVLRVGSVFHREDTTGDHFWDWPETGE